MVVIWCERGGGVFSWIGVYVVLGSVFGAWIVFVSGCVSELSFRYVCFGVVSGFCFAFGWLGVWCC